MPTADERVSSYRELAECYDRLGQDIMRDRFLVLAAEAALASHRKVEAEQIRTELLRLNPHHLLMPYASFEEAMKSIDVLNYVAALRQSHPFENAELLLEVLRPSSGPSLPLIDDSQILRLIGPEEPDDLPALYYLN